MKTFIVVCMALTCPFISVESLAQSIPVEVFAGHQAYRYQHNFSGKVNDWLGIVHSSSLLEFYKEKETEIMTQTYATIAVCDDLKFGLGTFYATVPGFNPSLNLQFTQKKSDWFLLIVPRIELKGKPAHELMLMFEFTPKLNTCVKLYSRIQLMENYTGSKHNRGYGHLRLGIHLKKAQIGAAAGLETYGNKYIYKDNYGIFIRTEL